MAQDLKLNHVYLGHARSELASFPDACIDTIVTSPPYFQQRDYTGRDQIGLEKTPSEYVNALTDVFAEALRVIKPSGSLWLNLGDKYDRREGGMFGLPWRVALALKDIGWILRSDVIWHKPNAMPSSTKTRLTTDHEYVFFMVKNKEYYYDADAIREPHVTFSENSRMKGGRNHFNKRGGTPEKGKNAGNSNLHDARWDQAFHPKGRNKRTVWSIPLSKFRDAHFAVFPEQLVQTCIRASCPPGGVVLDPFCGSGTTGVVALNLGRDFVGIDCVEKYAEMSANRIAKVSNSKQDRTGV